MINSEESSDPFERLLRTEHYHIEGYKIYNDPGLSAFIISPRSEVFFISQTSHFLDGRFPVTRYGYWAPNQKRLEIDQEDISNTERGKEITRIFEKAGRKYNFPYRKENPEVKYE